MFEAIHWPEDMKPSHCPIHFTNELEASPETIWTLLSDTKFWSEFYPGVQHVELLGGAELLQLGTQFETNLAGQDVAASVEEFEPITRIAWFGGPKASLDFVAYHAWIIIPTPKSCHLWTRRNDARPALDRTGQESDGCLLAGTSKAFA